MVLKVEVGHHMGLSSSPQRSIRVVNPTVVGAYERLAITLGFLANARPTMAAYIVHCPDLAIGTSGNNDRVLANVN